MKGSKIEKILFFDISIIPMRKRLVNEYHKFTMTSAPNV